MNHHRFLLAAICLLATACDLVQPSAPDAPEPKHQPLFEILDGSREGGNPGFYFLPPVGKKRKPKPQGEFSPDLNPVVQICEWTGTECGALIVEFTTGREGRERLKVHRNHYHADWHTKRFDLDPSQTYRIRVFVATAELGFADVDLLDKGERKLDKRKKKKDVDR